MEFRFSYFPSWDRLRLLVLRPPQQFTKWEAALRMAGKKRRVDAIRRQIAHAGGRRDGPDAAAGRWHVRNHVCAGCLRWKTARAQTDLRAEAFSLGKHAAGTRSGGDPSVYAAGGRRNAVERRLRAAQARTRRRRALEASFERRPAAVGLAHAAGNRIGRQDTRGQRPIGCFYRRRRPIGCGAARRGPPARCRAARSSSSITMA